MGKNYIWNLIQHSVNKAWRQSTKKKKQKTVEWKRKKIV